jgi:hypothetical protein
VCALVVVTVACVPALSSTDSLVTVPRILAVRADPAEAKPGTTVTFHALVADPPGVATGTPLWRFCIATQPLTEDNVVSNACLDPSSLLSAGDGADINASTPSNGCSFFGPDTPAGGLRPRDPDPTGGYYQPLRVDLGRTDPTFTLVRISCDLANASAGSAEAFAAAYVPNKNPHLLALLAATHGTPVAFDAVPVGSHVDLTASWPADSAETYAYYDATSDAVGTKREAMTVAWYSSAGSVDQEATGRAEDDVMTTSSNGWNAPSSAQAARLWVVLRDSRGGADFASYDVTVVH